MTSTEPNTADPASNPALRKMLIRSGLEAAMFVAIIVVTLWQSSQPSDNGTMIPIIVVAALALAIFGPVRVLLALLFVLALATFGLYITLYHITSAQESGVLMIALVLLGAYRLAQWVNTFRSLA